MFESLNKPMNVGDYSATPWAAISTGLQIVSSISSAFIGAKQNKLANAANIANYNAQMQQLEVQQRQTNQQAAQQGSVIQRQALAEKSRLTATLGEAGISGNTADRLGNELDQKANDALTNIDTNRGNAIVQSGTQGAAMKAQTDSKMRDPSINWSSLGLQIATSGLGFTDKLVKRKV